MGRRIRSSIRGTRSCRTGCSYCDPLAPARGILNGCLLAIPLWLVIILVAVLARRVLS